MRIEVIEADGWRIQVRGRTRRTAALESEYLISLKLAHADMKDLGPVTTGPVEAAAAASPHGWSLIGVASKFRYLVARIRFAEAIGGTTQMAEPFTGDQLAVLFDHYLDCDELPDRSDLWSRVEDTIVELGKPKASADPLAGSDTPSK